MNYNIVNVQAEASRQVSNDEMHATLYIEKSNKQPAELSNQINQLMNQALNVSRKYPQVKWKLVLKALIQFTITIAIS